MMVLLPMEVALSWLTQANPLINGSLSPREPCPIFDGNGLGQSQDLMIDGEYSSINVYHFR